MMPSPKMRVAVGQHPGNDKEYLDFALQLGCEGASFQTPDIKGDVKWDAADVKAYLAPVHAAGVKVESFENVPNHFYDKLMLGLPGRDEQLENMKSTIRALGEAGVPILGMHWMPQIVWRTDMGHFGRGGSYVSVYDHSIVLDRSRDSEIWVARRDERDVNLKDTFTRGSFVKLGVDTLTVDQMWANFEFFIKGIIKTCEESGVVICFHPDDPPAQELHGIARILTSVDNLERAMNIVDSPNLKFQYATGVLIFHFTSEVNKEDIFEYVKGILFGLSDSFFLNAVTDNVSVCLNNDVYGHLFDLDSPGDDLDMKFDMNRIKNNLDFMESEDDDDFVALLLDEAKERNMFKKPSLDQLLDKLLSKGMDSLSQYEKDTLEKYSK